MKNQIQKIILVLSVAIVLFSSLCIHAASALDVPAFKGYVNDYADMISPEMEMNLERALQSFDLTDSTQIAILTIDSLEGDSLEDFSIRTVTAWKIGRKGKDNGVLLLAAKNDRKIRIEVGRGLEGVLTDLMAGRIVDNIITPQFKNGSFDKGFEEGIIALIKTTRGEFRSDRTKERTGRKGHPSPLLTYLIFGGAILVFLGRISKFLGIIAGVFLLPLIVFLAMSSPFSLLLLLFLLPAGALAGLVLPILLGNMLSNGGGFYSGGTGYGGGGSFGGGGFGGFGSGSFGGGGASGSW